MKRWILGGALALPLPFAALPLIAVTLSSPGAPEVTDQAFAYEAAPIAAPAAATDVQPASLGFRLHADEHAACGSGLAIDG